MEGLIPVVIDHPVSSITQAEVESCAARVAEMAPNVWSATSASFLPDLGPVLKKPGLFFRSMPNLARST
jgi:hypothetical protein